MELRSTVPLLIIDELLEIVVNAPTLVTSNRLIDDWGKRLGDTAVVTATLDRQLHHGHILKCGPRSWRTRPQAEPSAPELI